MKKNSRRVLLVDDNSSLLSLYFQFLSGNGFEMSLAESLNDARNKASAHEFDIAIVDLKLPDGSGLDLVSELREVHPHAAIVVITAYADVKSVEQAMQKGATDFLSKPIKLEELPVFLEKCVERQRLHGKHAFRERLERKRPPFWGSSEPVQRALGLAKKAAGNDTVVLIQGETGAGKGVMARWIHDQSRRAPEPFVEINCSVLRGDLLASEIFGHSKGAFTNAVCAKQGLIDAANHGTLFLDEIGDMDKEVQAQLLNVIEEKKYRRVGEVNVRSSDFRLICATNHDLEDLCSAGQFRRDLFYRINVFPIRIPHLREIKNDIPDLVRHLLDALGAYAKNVSPVAMTMLVEYPWKGNIRELRNILERADLLSESDETIGPEHLAGLSIGLLGLGSSVETLNLAELEKAAVRSAITKYSGNVGMAAEALGISCASLYRKLRQIEADAVR